MAINLINIVIKIYNKLDFKIIDHKKHDYTKFIEWSKLYSSN